jgi:hypothetical protein
VQEWFNWPVSKTERVERLTEVRILSPPQRKNVFGKAELRSTLQSRLNFEEIYYVTLYIMIITICGSMEFHEKMREVGKRLKADGHTVFMPKSIGLMDTIGYVHPTVTQEKIRAKIQHDFIREHFRKIEKCDAILVLNYTKKRIKNYIGGNTFLEIGLAYWLGKKIFLLNPIPDMDYMTELHARRLIVLHGDLGKLQ